MVGLVAGTPCLGLDAVQVLGVDAVQVGVEGLQGGEPLEPVWMTVTSAREHGS